MYDVEMSNWPFCKYSKFKIHWYNKADTLVMHVSLWKKKTYYHHHLLSSLFSRFLPSLSFYRCSPHSLSQRQTALSLHLTRCNISITLLGDYSQRERRGNRPQNSMQHRLINSLSETCCVAALLQWFWLLPQRTAEGQWLGSKSTNGIRRRQRHVCVCVCVCVCVRVCVRVCVCVWQRESSGKGTSLIVEPWDWHWMRLEDSS